MATEETTATLAATIAGAIERRLRDLFVALPASVTRYDESRGEIDAQPLIMSRREAEGGEIVVERMPVVPSVPVAWQGGGGYRLTFPITVGDVVLLLFASASLDRWLQRGGEIDPGEVRFGGLVDGIGIPGLRPFASPWTGAATDHATLGRDGGAQIHLRASTITIGDESGSKAIGLHGDTVNCGTLTLTVAAGVLGGTYLDGIGSPPLAVASGTPILIKGALVASATQAKGK